MLFFMRVITVADYEELQLRSTFHSYLQAISFSVMIHCSRRSSYKLFALACLAFLHAMCLLYVRRSLCTFLSLCSASFYFRILFSSASISFLFSLSILFIASPFFTTPLYFIMHYPPLLRQREGLAAQCSFLRTPEPQREATTEERLRSPQRKKSSRAQLSSSANPRFLPAPSPAGMRICGPAPHWPPKASLSRCRG